MATTYTSRTGTHPEEGIKAPCVVASSANITLSGAQTVNGVAVVAGDRVLVKSQTDDTENGIYIVDTGAWTRATDWNNGNDVASGVVVVDNYNNAVWKAEFTGDYSPGTTSVTFSAVFQLSTPGAGSIGTAELAANSVTLAKMDRQTSGNILIGKGAGADMAAVAVSGDITITDAGVVTIANNAITAAKVTANTLTLAKLDRQTSAYILIGKGAGADVAAVAVSGDVTITNAGVVTIANSAINAAKIASDAVTTAKILNSNVTTAKIADGNVTLAKLSSAVQTTLGYISEYQQPAAQALANNTDLTFSHTLGAQVYGVKVWIKCTDAGGDAGYGQNEILLMSPYVDSTGIYSYGFSLRPTTTTVVMNIADDGLSAPHKTTHTNTALAAGKWDVYMRISVN